jgi:hypothetical protein
MSQFEAIAVAASCARKMETTASVFSQTISSDRIHLAAKNRGSPGNFLQLNLIALRQKSVASAERRAGGIRRAA